MWIGFLLDHFFTPIFLLLGKKPAFSPSDDPVSASVGYTPEKGQKKQKEDTLKKEQKKQKAVDKKIASQTQYQFEPQMWETELRPGGAGSVNRFIRGCLLKVTPAGALSQYGSIRSRFDTNIVCLVSRVMVLLAISWMLYPTIGPKVKGFIVNSHQIALGMSNAKVMFKSRLQDGREVIVDDYYAGYKWIDRNTPKDSRIMAWWDYGYQITGIARRTTLADGNTWNHEHIATLGRTLTSSEKKGWNAIRHLADYVLVWAGGRGDDIAKSRHLARIGNSVFPDHCGNDDPLCNKFSFNSDGSPTKMMAESVLYKMVMHQEKAGVKVNSHLFKEVHTTKYGLMRIFQVMNVSQESKDWVADPKNRVCDAPGSWYCVGQYPPALDKLIEKRRNFAQVEDFNVKGDKSAYTKMIEKGVPTEL